MLVQRLRFYHPDVWRDPSYRTEDGIIPFRLFWHYLGTLNATLAFDRTHHARAVVAAIAMAFRGKENGSTLPEIVIADQRDAYLRAP